MAEEFESMVVQECYLPEAGFAVANPFAVYGILKATAPQVDYRKSTVATVIEGLQEGLPVEALDRAQEMLGITRETLAKVLHASVRTLARRKVLAAVESEKLFRLTELFQRAVQVVGGAAEARRWFSSPKKALGGRTPLEYMVSDLGAREVENLLGRIEHGVFA